MSPFGSLDFETNFFKRPGYFEYSALILLLNGNEHSTFCWKPLLSRFLSLEISQTERIGKPQNFTGGAHFRPQERINFRIHVKGEYSFLYTKMAEDFVFQLQVFEFFAQHNLCGQTRHRNVAYLGNQRNRA